MKRVMHATILALVAIGLMVQGGHAAPAEQGTVAVLQTGLYARVMKPYGAAIRVAPSSDATIMFHKPCGDLWPVLAQQGGWVRIQTDAGAGWVGGARVAVGSPPPWADCSNARFLFTTGYVTTFVPTGCLSLRDQPSRQAAILACVPNGHVYLVTDGPFDPGTGEDWFEVYSPSTGSGWALADHLYRR